jgi:ribosomal protein S18 acetylase RimI-like enzyme
MPSVLIRCAAPDDLAQLDCGLRALSDELGHDHLAGIDDLAAAGFGPHPAFVALLAEAEGELVGLAVCSPLFSTVRGAAGVYVSDLWVSAAWRGQRLGERLLAEVRTQAAARWRARFLRLGVGSENHRARAFYERLGFTPTTDETMMTLTGAALAALEGTP